MKSMRKRKGAPLNNIKECKSHMHRWETCELPKRTYTVTSKDFSKKALAYLKEKRLFGANARYVMTASL